MQAGAITDYIDVPQLLFWAFFLAFVGIVVLLLREDRREGYPKKNLGLPFLGGPQSLPAPRTYIRLDGTTTVAPHHDPNPPVHAEAVHRVEGGPYEPVGDPLKSALGPGTYTMRRDEPFTLIDGEPQVQPLRTAKGWSVMSGETDPRGMRVFDVRFRPVGVVREIWVDRGVKFLRYMELELDAAAGGEVVMLPIHHCDINERKREIRVTALEQDGFAGVPRLRSPDQITAREEDMVNGYYAGGRFHNDGVVL